MATNNIDPLENLYTEFTHIINNIVVKYSSKAEENETLESKQLADQYMDVVYKRDDFLTYRDYTRDEFHAVGIYDTTLIDKYMKDTRSIPQEYQSALLENRREQILNTFEESNNYYRTINGYPFKETKMDKYHYVPRDICDTYGISKTLPIHRIQDYYNKIEPGHGDKLMSVLDGLEYISLLQKTFPNEEYLHYLGDNRIDIIKSRKSKNFEILRMDRQGISNAVYEAFTSIYEQCREYFMTTIYNHQFRAFFPFYDNFIGMSIMIMSLQQLVSKQIASGIRRIFFDINSLRLLYDTYNIPYDISIDKDVQMTIAQNINMLICNKSTNKVIYDVAALLGFPSIKVYKYYLAKERNFDRFGAPVVATRTRFNTLTGETETIPDYRKMYNLYFQKEELREDDFIQSFESKVNRISYDEVVSADPLWLQDTELEEAIWQTQYNFVETKYLSIGISYRMTDILFENVILLKLLMYHKVALADVQLSIPKIIDGANVPLFDMVILLLALVARKHNLNGEIITVPSEVISVIDYLNNLDGGNNDTVDSFAFDFDYFQTSQSNEDIKAIMDLLDVKEKMLMNKYISTLSFRSNATPSEKLTALNNMYNNIRNLLAFISYKMTTAKTLKEYRAFKTFYQAAFYAREMKSLFTITGELTGHTRAAKNLFEYLNYYNPKLYKAVFKVDYSEQYQKYLQKTGLTEDDLSLMDYRMKVELGEADCYFGTFVFEDTVDDSEKWNIAYRYITHIISKFKAIIDNVNFLYLIDDSSAALVDLLVKLIGFVKSLTTDMINMDTVYVCNMPQENMMKFFDDVASIDKSLRIDQSLNLLYSDDVHLIQSELESKDSMKFVDKAIPEKEIEITRNSCPSDYNKLGLRDKVVKIWYSDD